MLHLFTVADVFQIENHGCALAPGLPTGLGAPKVAIGARIRLQTPDGQELDTIIKAIEHLRYKKRPEAISLPVLLPENVTKNDVPIGTKVFLLEENPVGI